MRELKFRAWHKNRNKFIDLNGFSIHFGKHPDAGQIYSVTEQGVITEWSIDDIVINQWTGLNDKRGLSIYSGDIVEIIHPCWHATCETKFIDGAYFFIEKDNPVNNSQVRADKFLKEKWEIKVIGNIYENPELL